MRRLFRIFVYGLAGLFSAAVAAVAAAVFYAVFVLAPQLPSPEALQDVRYQQPLRIMSREGELIAEFGEKRRQPVAYNEIPADLLLAFIAAEDHRFFDHPGVDYQGLARAAWHLFREREVGPGGSTITMQVARNFFLSREQTFLRKANEILLALQIERVLTKEQILELYLNKIYLGNRAYGVVAAAEIYYRQPLDGLDLAQMAMIAGLPKAPSAYNPISNPRRAMIRRDYVLGRMLTEGYITAEQYEEAMTAPLTARLRPPEGRVEAHYVAEMARAAMVERYGEDEAYTGAYTVYTTVERELQHAANQALRRGLRAYDERHGFRGPEGRVDLAAIGNLNRLDSALRQYPRFGGLDAGVVLTVTDEKAWVWLREGEVVEVPFETMRWAARYLTPNSRGPRPEAATDVLTPGDIVRVERTSPRQGKLSAVPAVEGALVAVSPDDGRIRALAGGFDFRRSSYNRAVQASRQTGSAFKPFIYSAALEHGYTAATLVNDAPVVFRDEALESYWRPGNYSGRFYGPTRLREALIHSRNLVSIRVLRDVGIRPTIDFMEHAFSFDRESLPANLSLALGSNSATPLEMTSAYAVFANGGYRVVPHVIDRVEDADGRVVYRPTVPRVCPYCEDGFVLSSLPGDRYGLFGLPLAAPRVIPEQNAWLMTDMMRGVMTQGTGRGHARFLRRNDLAGKTGTTNDLRDAWFSGYGTDVVATAWVGFDDSGSLGAGETGASAALPIWSMFMAEALNGVPERDPPQPEGLVTVRIDPESGLVTSADNRRAIFETFRADAVPARDDSGREGAARGGEVERSLF